MRIVFFGSDDFAAVHLERLLAAGYQIVGCVTGPDRPQGRGLKMTASPIKQIASGRGIPCLQPPTLKDSKSVKALQDFEADFFVVVAYGRLLTQDILDIPKIFCINVHGSLLPQYRGAAPINWAILNGETETGVTIQKMALGLDSGAVIAQEKMAIAGEENAEQLRGRMAQAGADLLVRTLDKKEFTLTLQDETRVTWAPKLTKEMGRIDWNKPAAGIVNQVRGLQPWPGASTSFRGKMLKIIQAELSTENKAAFSPGEVARVNKEGFAVACSDGVVLIKEVQPEAGKIMPADSFAAGYKLAVSATFL